jgi:hypothetical protein
MRLRVIQEHVPGGSFTIIDMTITDITTATTAPTNAFSLVLPSARFDVGAARRQEPTYDFELVAFDLYRDIHKGIRSELFAITTSAGNVDPSDELDRIALADHVASVARVLEMHAEHEDANLEGPLREHAPALASRIEHDHHVLEARFSFVNELAKDLASATSDYRRLAHLLYLELTGFTSAYLAHQIVEERVVMPALQEALGVEAVVGIHMAIVGSIPPEDMAASLAFMLPAMNVDDRTELLGGMQQSAPPEAFAGVCSLARSVLGAEEFSALARRLGI